MIRIILNRGFLTPVKRISRESKLITSKERILFQINTSLIGTPYAYIHPNINKRVNWGKFIDNLCCQDSKWVGTHFNINKR